MSGVKQTFVCVEEDELERLKYNESRLLSLQSIIPEKLDNVRNQVDQDMQEKLRRIEKRQLEYQQYVYDLNGDLRYFEIENQRRFQEQNQKFHLLRSEYFELLRRQRDEYIDIFQEQDKKFTNLVEQEKNERKNLINGLQGQINSILDDNIKKQERVKIFTEELAKLIDETEKIPHKRFAPGKLEQIKRYNQDAINDVKSGFPETALSTARNAYWQLVDLRTLVLQKEQEYLTYYSAAIESTGCLIEKAIANRKRKIEVGKGDKKKEVELEVDYWTKGELSQFQKETEDIKSELLKNERTLSVEQVKEIIKNIEKKESEINSIVEKARENILSSQLRANIAKKAVLALKEQLFTVDSSAYAGDDPRNAFFVKVKNRAGSEIVTIISPVEGEFGKNELTIHSYDDKIVNQNALQDRAAEITGSLSKNGLEVGKLHTIDSVAKPEFRDIEKIRKQKSSLL